MVKWKCKFLVSWKMIWNNYQSIKSNTLAYGYYVVLPELTFCFLSNVTVDDVAIWSLLSFLMVVDESSFVLHRSLLNNGYVE